MYESQQGDFFGGSASLLLVTVPQLARASGMSKEVIRNKLAEAGVEPIGSNPKAPTFHFWKAARGILLGRDVSPEELAPAERLALARAKREELTLAKESGDLCAAEDVRAEMGDMARIFAKALDTFPDVLEADFGLTPEQVAEVRDRVDQIRNHAYEELLADAPS